MSRLRWPDSTNSVSEKPGTIQCGLVGSRRIMSLHAHWNGEAGGIEHSDRLHRHDLHWNDQRDGAAGSELVCAGNSKS